MNITPQAWKELEKRIRKDRAKNKCERCGVSNNAYDVQGRDIQKIKLVVIHVVSPTSNDESNLLCVCQRCRPLVEDEADKKQVPGQLELF